MPAACLFSSATFGTTLLQTRRRSKKEQQCVSLVGYDAERIALFRGGHGLSEICWRVASP